MKINLKLVRALLAIAIVCLFSWRAETAIDDNAFIELARTGTPQEVQNAISAGANVNARDENGITALMAAAEINNNPEVITALIRSGADVNARNQADSDHNHGAITALIEGGADVHARDSHGRTALWFAERNSNPEIAATLLEHGACADCKCLCVQAPLTTGLRRLFRYVQELYENTP